MSTGDLDYITEKLQFLVFIDPDKSSGSLGRNTAPSIDMPQMQRSSQFFNIMMLQLTFVINGMPPYTSPN